MLKPLIVNAAKTDDVDGPSQADDGSAGSGADLSWTPQAWPQEFPLFTPGSAAAGAGGWSTGAASRASAVIAPGKASGSNGPGPQLTFVTTITGNTQTSFGNCVQAAENFLMTVFKPINSVTATVSFDEEALGTHNYFFENNNGSYHVTTFAALKAALPTSDVLPSTDHSSGGTWWVPGAYGRMLGISTYTPPAGSYDSEVHLNSSYGWNFGQDVITGLIHELSEGVMGRVASLGQGGGGQKSNSWSTMDLFRYTSIGYDTANGADGLAAYFSSDGGKTENTNYQLNDQKGASSLGDPSTDAGDWIGNGYNGTGKVFGGVAPGSTLNLAPVEFGVMQALGWSWQLPEDFMEASGAWQDPTTWSMACMPIADPEDAYIGGLPNVVNATLGTNATVNSIGTQAGNTLEIESNNTLKAWNGTQINSATVGSTLSGNAGDIFVDSQASLQIGVAFYNSGVLTVGGQTSGNFFPANLFLGGSNSVVFSGGGHVHLGAAIAGGGHTFADVNGYGLTNVDNTIDGYAAITVTTFDNQVAGTIIANVDKGGAYLGAYLEIDATTFSNEGQIDVATNARLVVGNFGASTVNNSGTINLGWDGANAGAGAQLVIDGTVTFAGTGSLVVRGAGAEITSDYFDPETFVNTSNVNIKASAQIGDVGVYSGVNNLTFVNRGQLQAYGSGVVAVLNTGAKTIDDGGGLLEAVGAGTLEIDSNVTTGQSYATGGVALPGGTIEAITGGKINLSAAISAGPAAPAGQTLATGKVVVQYTGNLTIESGGSVSVPLSIYGPAAQFGAGVVTVQSGGSLTGPVTFASVGAKLNLTGVTTPVSASGKGGIVSLTNSSITLSGNSEAVTFVGAGDVATINSSNSASDTFAGFGIGDTAAFADVTYAASDFVTFVGNGAGTGGTVTIDNVSGTAVASLLVTGDYTPSDFQLSNVGGDLALVGAAGLARPTSEDFNGDGVADILWRDPATGADALWDLTPSGGRRAVNPGTVAASSVVAGVGDFNNDGVSDILWRNTATGADSIWDMTPSGGHTTVNPGTVATSYQVAGVGDFNGDGVADILWRNGATGADSIWDMTPSGGRTAVNPGTVATSYVVAGVGDFNGDGISDILWRNTTTGADSIWDMNASGGHTAVNPGTVATAYVVAGVGDFNGDGIADILWRNASTGADSIWDMTASGGHTAVNPGTVATNWQVATVSDFNGDGVADILWRDPTTGADTIWAMNASGGHTTINPGTVASNWTVAA